MIRIGFGYITLELKLFELLRPLHLQPKQHSALPTNIIINHQDQDSQENETMTAVQHFDEDTYYSGILYYN